MPRIRRLMSRVARYTVLTVALAVPAKAAPPFDATADTVFDIITTDDPSSLVCLETRGRGLRQMWDKRQNEEFDLNAHLFLAYYADGPTVEFVVNPEFSSTESARAEAQRHAHVLGQLPPRLRTGITRFGIHAGRESFHGGPGKIFVYSGMSDKRSAQSHLEESVFHESVHATLDKTHAPSPSWRSAQAADGAFVTRYAQRFPAREDLAETALFAWALITHPDRMPPVDSRVIHETVPARIAFFRELFASPHNTGDIPIPPSVCE